MSSTTRQDMVCAGCGYTATPGTALRVTDRATGASFPIHRGGDGSCMRAAGPASRSTISLWDVDAARLHDMRSARPRERRSTTQETTR